MESGQIFISYSKNRDIVKALAEDLDLLDYDVWFDRELNRRGGHKWWEVILDNIRLCDLFLFALSPDALKSYPCTQEYKYAAALDKRILPVLLSDVEIRRLPQELRELQIVDYRQRSREQLVALKATLRNLPPVKPMPDPLPPEPEMPFHRVDTLMTRIKATALSPDEQKLLIREIEDLSDDEQYADEVPNLLTLLSNRNDVLTIRNLEWIKRLLNSPEIITSRMELAYGAVRTDSKGVAQVWVPPGCFLMGSDPEIDYKAKPTEQPQHEVCITYGFWLDKYPVTNIAYQQFINEGGYKKQKYWSEDGWKWLVANGITGPEDPKTFTGGTQHPRVGLSWYEAEAYAYWRDGRLPTEAEWEWAARGQDALIYPWGNAWDRSKTNTIESKLKGTTQVGSYENGKSWCGAYDMAGNVGEWIADWFDENYYSQLVRDDPQGPTSGICRVLRIGSWKNDAEWSRAAARRIVPPDQRFDDWGVRVVTFS